MGEPFHSDGIAVQEETGERATAALNGRNITPTIPMGAKLFVSQQDYCVIGWESPEREVWAYFFGSHRGFASSESGGAHLDVDMSDVMADPERMPPPLNSASAADSLGLLFIELATRRRLRVNGRISRILGSKLRLDVAEAFPACPKYIQRREVDREAVVPTEDRVDSGTTITPALADWIRRSDTFFIASAHPHHGVDVSHRGGMPGFVRFDGSLMRIPDYPGNSMFQTLGNLAAYPRAGVCFPDFAANRQLQISGSARLDLRGGDHDGETAGTGRWWVFQPERWFASPITGGLRWRFVDRSPYNPEIRPRS